MWLFIVIGCIVILIILYQLLSVYQNENEIKNDELKSRLSKIYCDDCHFICPKCETKTLIVDLGCENCGKKSLEPFYWFTNGFLNGKPWFPFADVNKENERICCRNCDHKGFIHCPKCSCLINMKQLTHDIDPSDPRI